MATITSILNRIALMRRKTGKFAIRRDEFFSTLEDIVNKVDEVNSNVNSVAKSLVWQAPVTNFAALAATYPNPERGWASLVQSEGIIYAYNGSEWKSTGLTAFPDDIELKSRTYIQLTDPASEAHNNVKNGDAWVYLGLPLTRYERIDGLWVSISSGGGSFIIIDEVDGNTYQFEIDGNIY